MDPPWARGAARRDGGMRAAGSRGRRVAAPPAGRGLRRRPGSHGDGSHHRRRRRPASRRRKPEAPFLPARASPPRRPGAACAPTSASGSIRTVERMPRTSSPGSSAHAGTSMAPPLPSPPAPNQSWRSRLPRARRRAASPGPDPERPFERRPHPVAARRGHEQDDAAAPEGMRRSIVPPAAEAAGVLEADRGKCLRPGTSPGRRLAGRSGRHAPDARRNAPVARIDGGRRPANAALSPPGTERAAADRGGGQAGRSSRPAWDLPMGARWRGWAPRASRPPGGGRRGVTTTAPRRVAASPGEASLAPRHGPVARPGSVRPVPPRIEPRPARSRLGLAGASAGGDGPRGPSP